MRRLSVAVWERWALDCSDPHLRRLYYPSRSPLAELERTSRAWDVATDWDARAWERNAPDTVQMANRVAREMRILDRSAPNKAAAVRARWSAGTDERPIDVARRLRVSRARVSQLANDGESSVEQAIQQSA